MTTVAMFGDRNVVAPTHVALASTLAHWTSAVPLEVHFFHSGWTQQEIECLRQTAARFPGAAHLHVQAVDLSPVASWRPLYGTLMPYARLFLPDLLPDQAHALYMDVDVIVEIDVRQVLEAGMSSGPVAAMKAWDFAHSHDAELAQELRIDMNAPYFHSGLLTLDLDWCRKANVVQRFVEFGDRYASRLRSHDQTILNCVLQGQIGTLPPELTTHLYPTGEAPRPARAAIHNYCGSPKPFDPLGNVLNAHYGEFQAWVSRTALTNWSPNSIRELLRLRRNMRLLRPIVGTLAKMIRKTSTA